MLYRSLSTLTCTTFLCGALAGCSAPANSLRYSLHVNMQDPVSVVALVGATQRVLTRRLAAIGETKATVSAVPTGGSGGTLTISLQSAEVEPRVKTMLAEPFSFDIRKEKVPVVTGSGTTASSIAAAEWVPTGITKEHLYGVRTITNEQTGESSIELNFSADGKALLQQLFQENKGKNIGIFVRDVMVSRLLIESDQVNEQVIISGIPSATVGDIFSDDVNVGLYVTYTPME